MPQRTRIASAGPGSLPAHAILGMMAASVDTIAIRLSPVPGEALDSWLEAYARRLYSGMSDIFHLALAPAEYPGQVPERLRRLLWLSPAECSALSSVSAIPEPRLNEMTMAYYDGILVSIDEVNRTLRRSHWWSRASGSRYCPQCLASNDGRWLLAWRLPWSFACLRHQVLLADCCPSCGARARFDWSAGDKIPGKAECQARKPGQGTGRELCGQLLFDADAHPLLADGLILQAQEHVDGLIDNVLRQNDHGRRGSALRHMNEELDDIYTAGTVAISALVTSVAPAKAAQQVLTELGNPEFTADKGSARYKRHGPRRDSASSIAFCVAVAVAMLRDGPACPDDAIIRWLAEASVAYASKVYQGQGPAAILRPWRKATPDLRAAVLKCLDPHLTGSQRLRYGTSTKRPGLPIGCGSEARARAVPALMWPGWALRLNPGLDSLPYRRALSVMLLHAASADADYAAAGARLGHMLTTSKPASHFMRRLRTAGALDAVVSALAQLARRLDELGAPIDYARRRILFSPESFDRAAWRRNCDHIGHPRWPGQERIAGLRLAELLTGSHPRYFSAPFGLNGFESYRYTTLALALPAELSAHLHEQAARLLGEAGITELVQWEPPFEWVEDICWPGPAVCDVPPEEIRELLQAGLTPQAIAGLFSTTIEHVRLAAQQRPAQLPANPAKRRPNAKIARSALPGADEIRGYYNAGLGRRPLARLAGCSETTAGRLLSEAGLPARMPGYRTAHISAEWLTDRYVNRRLTLSEIGDEAGLSPQCLAHLAHKYGIELRRGGGAHRNALTQLGRREDYPPEIWAAFSRSGGEQRVRRVVAAMSYPSLRAAARTLHVSDSVICVQIASLERDIGFRLINRGPGMQNTATPQGQRFARQAHRILNQLDQLQSARATTNATRKVAGRTK